MATKRELPNVNDLVDFNLAVAGHPGTLCSTDNALFIKPCTKQEIDFYESARKHHEDFAQLMPTWYGMLQLVGKKDINSITAAAQLPSLLEGLGPEINEQVAQAAKELLPVQPVQPVRKRSEAPDDDGSIMLAPNKSRKIDTKIAIVMDNEAHAFNKPNILDCKLGVRLWADDASQEKKNRFDGITAESTHKNLGFRIAGMRVYRGSEDPEDLEEEYMKYDKDYGRVHVNDDNVVDAFRKFIFNNYAGVDSELGRIVAGLFLEDLRHVEKVLSSKESRMYSASLLFVFEGDGEALRARLEKALAWAEKSPASEIVSESEGEGERQSEEECSEEQEEEREEDDECTCGSQSSLHVDSGIDVGEDEARSLGKEGFEICICAGDSYDDDGDDDDDDYDAEKERRLHSLNLIDFAHALFTPGEGPDENCLIGVRSLIKIFEELMRAETLEVPSLASLLRSYLGRT